MFKVLSLFLSGAISLSLISTSVHAAPVNQSDWQDHQGMLSTRIVTASSDVLAGGRGRVRAEEGNILLAWEAKLADGWKTYWRSPGEAGLPVRLYRDEQDIDLYYPVPDRFELFGLQTFGYSKSVVIPFELAVSEGTTQFRADFMVCKEICVPFEATYELDIEPSSVGNIVADTKVNQWLNKLPYIDNSAPGGLRFGPISLAGKPGHQSLIVEVSADHQLNSADLLAELDASTQFPSPRVRLLGDGKTARFVLPAVSAKAGRDISGKRVRLTMTDGRGNAIERFFEVPQ